MEILNFLFLAVTMAVAGVIQPGPTSTLLISQSIRYGTKEGLKIAIAPLITDIPIILIVTFLLSKVSGSNTIVGSISLLGAGYLLYLAYVSLVVKPVGISDKKTSPQSLRKGVITNALNPAPYLFWLTLGAAMLQKALEIGPWMIPVYLVLAYATFVGGYALLAILVGKFRNMLQSNMYVWIVRLMGLILAIFAVTFLIRGLKLLGVLAFAN